MRRKPLYQRFLFFLFCLLFSLNCIWFILSNTEPHRSIMGFHHSLPVFFRLEIPKPGVPDKQMIRRQFENVNVHGMELQICSTDPLTGFLRNGTCETNKMDLGVHVICAQVTDRFLEYSRSRGNDLTRPSANGKFPGLEHGDHWCLCADRWKEALKAGVAPPVLLQSTHHVALEYIPMYELKRHGLRRN